MGELEKGSLAYGVPLEGPVPPPKGSSTPPPVVSEPILSPEGSANPPPPPPYSSPVADELEKGPVPA